MHGNFLQFLNHIKSSSSTTSRELDINSRLVVDEDGEDDYGKLRPERVNPFEPELSIVSSINYKQRIAVAILDLQWMKMT